MTEVNHGRLTNMEKIEGNLHIVLNTAGQRALAEIQAIRDRLGSVPALRVILSDHLKRRWTEILPEEIGALTSATILSDEAVRDQAGKLISVARVYWHERYQIECPIQRMAETGFVRFDGAD